MSDSIENSVSPFERIPDPLRRAIEARGFTDLTAVQTAALDAVDGDRDLRISSQTGSGKTVALGMAIAPVLLAEADATRRGPEAIIIVPTRELAAQVHKELQWLYENVPGVKIDSVTGGTSVPQERRRLGSRPRILVGTPGRLVDHITTKALDCSGVSQLVLDEADQMLDMGFRDELDAILTAIPSEGRRTHMLSATFPDGVRRLAEKFQSNPLHVEGTQLGAANEDIDHIGHLVAPRDRYAAVVNLLLLSGDQRTLIFVATRAAAAELSEKLSNDGFPSLPLSGDLAQAQRTRTLNAFRAGTVTVLVATDVAARGLDVPEVTTVIHGDLPLDAEVYTHRSGRTGRAGKKGRSILLTIGNRERRARRLLADARVEATWQPAPNAAAVDRALKKRARRKMRKAIEEGAEPSEALVEFAQSLLEGRDPAHVLATLLGEMRQESVREPMDIQVQTPRGADRGPMRSGPPTGHTPHGRPGHNGYRPAGEKGFARFTINWGFRNGANPRRLLAAICRRGEVESRVIGAIDIDAYSASFDVAADAAAEFERRASRTDARDPQQRIERARHGQGQGGPGRGGPRGRKPFHRSQAGGR